MSYSNEINIYNLFLHLQSGDNHYYFHKNDLRAKKIFLYLDYGFPKKLI